MPAASELHRYLDTNLHLADVLPLQTLNHFFHHILHARLMSLCHLLSFVNLQNSKGLSRLKQTRI